MLSQSDPAAGIDRGFGVYWCLTVQMKHKGKIRITSNLFILSSFHSCLNHIPNAYFIKSPHWHSDRYRLCWNVSVTRIGAAEVDFWNLFLTVIYLGQLFMLAQFILEFCLPGSLRTWSSTRVFVSYSHNTSNVCKKKTEVLIGKCTVWLSCD